MLRLDAIPCHTMPFHLKTRFLETNERDLKVRRKYNSNSSNSGTTIKNVKCMFYVLFLSLTVCAVCCELHSYSDAAVCNSNTEYTNNHCFGCVVWPMPIYIDIYTYTYSYNTFLLLQLQLPLIYCSPDALCALINIKTCTYISK